MSEWCKSRGQEFPIAWISLDKGDNDPVRFLSYLLAALQTVQDGLGQDTGAVIQGAQNPSDESILSVLVNELSSVSQDFVLVLEDYHVIELREIHHMMVFLLEHIPPQIHLVILTRLDPPFPLARLRARGELLEIRAKDLRFSLEDADTLLRDMVGLHLSEENVQILLDRTEGWITGLQLVALSIQGIENPSELIATFGGGHEYIVDYLIEEVLERQPDNLKMFLLQTSILNRLNGSLCDAITGQSDCEATLEHLVISNLFISPLGGENRWYRYHHLLADVLKNRLQRFYPEQITALHSRAAKWLEQNGLFSEAIEHALAANDYLLAAKIVESQVTDLLKLGNLSTLMGWLNRLPPEIVNSHPRLGIGSAWIYLLIGKLENVENYLTVAEANLKGMDDSDEIRGEIAAIRSYAVARMGKPDQAIEQAQLALELLPEYDLTVRCVVTFVLGGIYYMQKDYLNAIVTMKEASRLGERAGNIHVAVSALSSAGDLLRDQLDFAESEKAYYQALHLGTGHSGHPLPITASVYSGLAELRLAQKDFSGAREFALTGLELGEKWVNADSMTSCSLTLAQIAQHEGNLEEASAALERAKKLAASHHLSPGFKQRILYVEKTLLTASANEVEKGMLIDPLSERELEVLRLFAEGLSNQEIADKLIISLGTVKAHSSNIYRKIGIRQLTRWYCNLVMMLSVFFRQSQNDYSEDMLMSILLPFL